VTCKWAWMMNGARNACVCCAFGNSHIMVSLDRDRMTSFQDEDAMHIKFRKGLLALAALVLMAARAEPLYTVQQQPVPAAVTQKLSRDQYVRLYADAALQKGWQPMPVEPGRIRATLTIRAKHSLTVDILYDARSYSIVLVTSQALNEGGGRIHPAANKAIRGLQDAVQAALSRASF
jgi:hypothetical protein